MQLIGQPLLRTIQALGQQVLSTHRHHLAGSHQDDHRNRGADCERRQGVPDQHVEREKRCDPDKSAVRQNQLGPVASAVRTIPAPRLEHCERDHQGADDQPDAGPQFAALETH